MKPRDSWLMQARCNTVLERMDFPVCLVGPSDYLQIIFRLPSDYLQIIFKLSSDYLQIIFLGLLMSFWNKFILQKFCKIGVE